MECITTDYQDIRRGTKSSKLGIRLSESGINLSGLGDYKLYYSKYHVKLGKKAAAKAKQKKNSANEAQEKSKKDTEVIGA